MPDESDSSNELLRFGLRQMLMAVATAAMWMAFLVHFVNDMACFGVAEFILLCLVTMVLRVMFHRQNYPLLWAAFTAGVLFMLMWGALTLWIEWMFEWT